MTQKCLQKTQSLMQILTNASNTTIKKIFMDEITRMEYLNGGFPLDRGGNVDLDFVQFVRSNIWSAIIIGGGVVACTLFFWCI